MKKIIYIALATLIGVFLVILLAKFVFISAPPEGEEIPPELETETGKVSLTILPKEGTYYLNEVFKVEILIDTKEKEVSGTDVILEYDPQLLQPEYFNDSFLDTKESVFSTFPFSRIDKEKGEIKFSALIPPGNNFKGQGKIAALRFRAIKAGSANLTFQFEEGSTIDSNIAWAGQGKDILEKVNNATYLIKE